MAESNEWVARHLPCPKCDSSDAFSINDKGWGKCFSCGASVKTDDDFEVPQATKQERGLVELGEYKPLNKRGIDLATVQKWDYTTGRYNGQPCQIANYKNGTGQIVAQKVRFPSKDFVFLGDTKAVGLYGQWLWKEGGKMVVVTEGEIDALSVSQLQGLKWPTVSVPNGAQGATKTVRKEIEWLLKFDKVVFLFDNDAAGQEAARKCAELLPPGRAAIARTELKDANDMLKAGRGREVIDAVFSAKEFRPDGIVNGREILSRLQNRPKVSSYPYPNFMQKLNEKTYGIRLGELDVWTSGSGMGKTTVIKQLQHHFLCSTDHNQAIIHLEEPLEDTAEGIMAIHMGKRITLPDIREGITDDEYVTAYDETFGLVDSEGNYRLNLYDAFGSLEENDLYNKIRYFATGLNCKVIWLDHLSILVSDMGEGGDERRAIDAIMHNLKSLTVELGIYIGLIVHLKKAPQGKSFEEGYTPSLDDLRGSGGIKQLANSVYCLSRNQQHANPIARNTSQISVLKCRYTGRTGGADFLFYEDQTGRMVEGVDPETLSDFQDETVAGSEDF